MEALFVAPDIECDGCANSIRTALGGVHGVSRVTVDTEAKSVRVSFDSDAVDEDHLAEHLAEIGFPVGRE
ncbi:MAG: heavy-metal-associated domain-containing protein [Capsulimonadaceae bacterium]